MRYLMMIMGNADYEAGKPPSAELQQAMGEFIGKSAQAGQFVDGGGLLPSRHAFKARARDGKISFTDGPFAEAKEIIGGYSIVELPDDEAARRMVKEFIDVHIKAGVMDVDCEIRPIEAMSYQRLHGLTDMGPYPHSDRGDGFGLVDEVVPGLARCVDDGVVGVEDGV